VVTYGEHGGFWTTSRRRPHPASATNWARASPNPDRLPLLTKTGVTHISYGTSSILETIEHRWSLAPLGTRDAAVDDFTVLFAYR
jgi:phospholipase C